ncbi:MAG TPA: homocysteine S-methyltransferase family protein [Sphingomicrobium sp.]|nr:homocysteine S-methyltransferase family protein [Sphingomicrobium sp.]
MSAADALRAAAAQRILVKDGAYGTSVQSYRLQEAAYAGELGLGKDQRGNNDLLNLTQPELVRAICRSFAEAGADILATNTFNANAISQADYGAEHLVREINVAAARITREVADADGKTRWVAGALGPTNKTLSLSPDVNDPAFREVDFDQVKAVYREQIDALVEGGVDFILIETIFDTLNAKAGIMATLEAGEALGRPLPLMISMTLTDLSGRNLSGHTVEAFWASVRHARPVTIGLNCSFGAAQLRPHLAALARQADTLVMAYPNAGLPNELGEYDEAAAETAAQVSEWVEEGLVNIVGGCCGTTAEHIRAIGRAISGRPPRAVPAAPAQTLLAGLEPMVLAA